MTARGKLAILFDSLAIMSCFAAAIGLVTKMLPSSLIPILIVAAVLLFLIALTLRITFLGFLLFLSATALCAVLLYAVTAGIAWLAYGVGVAIFLIMFCGVFSSFKNVC